MDLLAVNLFFFFERKIWEKLIENLSERCVDIIKHIKHNC